MCRCTYRLVEYGTHGIDTEVIILWQYGVVYYPLRIRDRIKFQSNGYLDQCEYTQGVVLPLLILMQVIEYESQTYVLR